MVTASVTLSVAVGPQSEVASHGREAMAVGAGGSWLHGIHSQEMVLVLSLPSPFYLVQDSSRKSGTHS